MHNKHEYDEDKTFLYLKKRRVYIPPNFKIITRYKNFKTHLASIIRHFQMHNIKLLLIKVTYINLLQLTLTLGTWKMTSLTTSCR